ncbi:MAG: CPBP family intramembrane metalloprotease [Candidatus Eiseniibacteriota bacterium]|nr:MAG: CPBP family intramembrane metalloprotease [Candidatus Eisenbacteria bacterium]
MREEIGQRPESTPTRPSTVPQAHETQEGPGPYPRPLFAVAVVLICFLLLQVFTLVFSAILGIHYAVAPAFVVGGIVPILLAARWLTSSVKVSLRLSSVRAGGVLFCIGASFSFIVLQYNVASLIDKIFPMPVWIQEFLLEITRVRSFLEFLRVASGVVVAAAVAEELLFRGFLQGSLEKRYGRWRGILLTSLLFALLHDPWRFVPIFFVGGLLGYLVSRGGSVYYGMVAHAVTNATSVAGGNLFGIKAGTEVSLPISFVVLMAAVFLLSMMGFVRSVRVEGKAHPAPEVGESTHLTGK